MADAKDVAIAIAAALTEVGVGGTVAVEVDGEKKVLPVDDAHDADVVVRVMVELDIKAD